MISSKFINSDFWYADTLWKAPDALQGQVDVVSGLPFLKYISGPFAARRNELRQASAGQLARSTA